MRLPPRLAAFAALALFGALHWQTLVLHPATWRSLLVVATATGCAAVLGVLGRVSDLEAPLRIGRRTLQLPADRQGAWIVRGAAFAVAVVAFLGALVAAGLPARLLLPAHWSELSDGLDRGLAGAQIVDWPYGGPDVWIRLSILLGAPLLTSLAAVLAFFPLHRGRGIARAAALVALLVLYGLPATEHDHGAPLLRGLVLLVLVAAWLWLPRLGRRDLAIAAVAVIAAGIVALPAAAALDTGRGWWNYSGLTWFGDGKRVTFDWTHSYGPLDWPRDGTTLLYVKSNRPHYWKAESLDAFDGFRWARSADQDANGIGADLPPRQPDSNGRWDYFEANPAWNARIRFTVRSLSSDLIVGAGTTYAVQGVERRSSSADGTMLAARPLHKGDSYEVGAYAPDPSAAQMRGAPRGYPGALSRYAEISLPNAGESALQQDPRESARERAAQMAERARVSVPLRDSGYGDRGLSRRQLSSSPYGEMYDVAQQLTVDQPTAYDAVKAIENYLQDTFTYSERPPSERYPLEAFLFKDRIGYCQQFSGAMALMLRMAGIPARVAAGFSPGSYNKDSGEYRVRDLDAHSWVEVYFTGIGWIPFDPTPSAAPAESQSNGAGATSAARGDAGEVRGQGGDNAAAVSERSTDTGAPPSAGDGPAGWIAPVLLGVLALLAGARLLTVRRLRARRGLGPQELSEAQLAELRAALLRLGWNVPAGTTLLELERRLGRVAGPASAEYAAALRAHRYDPSGPAAPGASERRALRRELTAHGGLRARLRGLRALPPGGPRPA